MCVLGTGFTTECSECPAGKIQDHYCSFFKKLLKYFIFFVFLIGTYSNKPGASNCTNCPINTISQRKADSCTECNTAVEYSGK